MSKKSPKNSAPKKIRYAAVGLGHITQTALLPSFKHARENSELTALVSSDPAKLKKLGRRYGVKRLAGYEDYERLLRSGEIDAVYIGTPNSTHTDFAVAALKRGVHVLCEKPMAVTEAACRQMIRAAERSDAKLMIAYRLHFEAANLEAMRIARSRELGELKIFNSVFGVPVKDVENIRLRGDLGGGPLYDIGIYCINAARYLFRAEPTEAFSMAASGDDERFQEVDESVAGVLRFPGDRLASFSASFGSSEASAYDLIGTKGRLRLEGAYDYAAPMTLSVTVGEKTRKKKFRKRDQFGPELLYFSDCVLRDRQPEPSGIEGLADVAIIRALLESQWKRAPVALEPVDAGPRPAIHQRITKPGIRPPKTVHVTSPSGDRA